MVEFTSIESYEEEVTNGLETRQSQVYNALAKIGPATDREIAAALLVGDPNFVRPRRYELVEEGSVKCVGTKTCEVTGKKAKAWKII